MKDLLNKSWVSNLITVSTIVCGVFYLEDRISKTVYDAVNPLKLELESMDTRVKEVRENQIITDFKLAMYEKYFVKPDDIKIKNDK